MSVWVPIISALIAALVSYIICCRNSYISTITSERTKWLTGFREHCARVICQLANAKNIEEVRHDMQFIQNLGCDSYLLILQLNPKKDKLIIDKISKAVNEALDDNGDCNELINELVHDLGMVLNDTWEEIKDEARPWYLTVFINLKKRFCCCDENNKSG